MTGNNYYVNGVSDILMYEGGELLLAQIQKVVRAKLAPRLADKVIAS